MIRAGTYVLCLLLLESGEWERVGDGGFSAPMKIRAGLTTHRFHNGCIVKLISGGFAVAYDDSMRAATDEEIARIEADWRDAEQSRARVNHAEMDNLLERMKGVL